MAGYLILFAFILCGLGASFALFREKSPLIRIWIGCCMGLVMMMCLPPAWAFLFNFARTAQLLGLGTAMAIAGGCIFFTRKRRSENASFSGDMPLWLLCITLPLIILSAYLMYTHYNGCRYHIIRQRVHAHGNYRCQNDRCDSLYESIHGVFLLHIHIQHCYYSIPQGRVFQ